MDKEYRELFDKYYLKQMGCIDCLFESLPQLIIQTTNNSLQDEWSSSYYVSASFSCAMMVSGCLQFCIASLKYSQNSVTPEEMERRNSPVSLEMEERRLNRDIQQTQERLDQIMLKRLMQTQERLNQIMLKRLMNTLRGPQ